MKVHPYYATDPQEPEVFHDYPNCPVGQQIGAEQRGRGTSGFLRCLFCISLDGSDAPPAVVVAA